MVLHNSISLRALDEDAGWRPGDDTEAIHARFSASVRSRTADEALPARHRRETEKDIASLSR